MSSYRFKAAAGHSLSVTRWARLSLAAPLAWLLGCTPAVPLPPWTPALSSPAASAAPTAPGVLRTSPVTPQPNVAALTAPQTPAPYSAAVAARFPAPAMVYGTPGLQAGRTSFTTQAEMQRWLHDQADALTYSVGIKAAVLTIGQSQKGQTIEALVLTRGTGTDAAALRASGRPTVLLIAQQHGNEPAGGEALLVIARELAQGLLQPLLEQINVVIVPRANPDGAASGQSATASGRDLSRDHLLLATPEAKALARLTRDFQPITVLDAHEYAVHGNYLQKFGAVQKYDALFHYTTTANLSEFLTKAAAEWYRRPLLAALKSQGLSIEWSYTTSADVADKKLSMDSIESNISPNTDGLKNIVSLRIDSRGAGLGRIDIQRRVHTQVTAITSVLGSTAQRAKELSQLRPYIDKEISAQACNGDAVVETARTPAQYDLTMLDPVSGADKIITMDWDSTLALIPVKKRARPCGYWLSASFKAVAERLRLQGVQVQRVLAQSALSGELYREAARPAKTLVAGTRATPPAAGVTLVRSVIDAPAGSYYIALNQPLANLVIAALEPDAPGSYYSNQLITGLSSIGRVMSPPSLQSEELP
jgi:hypothetical protein